MVKVTVKHVEYYEVPSVLPFYSDYSALCVFSQALGITVDYCIRCVTAW